MQIIAGVSTYPKFSGIRVSRSVECPIPREPIDSIATIESLHFEIIPDSVFTGIEYDGKKTSQSKAADKLVEMGPQSAQNFGQLIALCQRIIADASIPHVESFFQSSSRPEIGEASVTFSHTSKTSEHTEVQNKQR